MNRLPLAPRASAVARALAFAGVVALAACSSTASLGTNPAVATSTRQQTTSAGGATSGTAGHVRYGPPSHHVQAGGGWISSAATKGGILYGSSYNGAFINLYSSKGNDQQVTGQLTSGLVSPQGMVVDAKHQLWVANTNASNIVAFKRGATTPFTTLDDSNYYPVSVAVDSQGTVYAANVVSLQGPPGNVAVYANGSTMPTAYLTYSGFLLVLGLGVDASDNLYVSYQPMSGPPDVVMFPKGSSTGQPFGIADVSNGDIVFDNSNNLAMEDGQGGLGIWAPPYVGGPTRSIPAFGNQPTFNKKEKKVWVAYANFSNPKIIGYNYTSGKLVDTITNGWTVNTAIPYGVALDPSAPL
jgi:hypothetical protein